ncbi:MAG: class I tRNA ligase family protein [Patescibacteria group bacterium]|jgi:leucyl-tRNA synthetase
MAEKYPFKDIEPKWQQWWEAHGVYHAENPDKTEKQKFYGLVEFPYPSGEGLHVGHPRSYTAIDLITRKRRMQNRNVMYPIGWDAFGLPAENFAIKKKIHPSIVTTQNIATFKRQIQSLGLGFDWTREINTTDPAYYRWTQWMFIQFYESWYDEKMGKARSIQELVIPQDVELKGQEAIRAYKDAERMAYKAKTTINWCPRDKIGLSNEEAQGGICDRCGGPVEKREKEQWMFRITKYANRLIKELDQVDYLEKIKTQQINWIGKSEGALVRFVISTNDQEIVEVFTTRPDTLFGATYLVLSPEHEKVQEWIESGAVTNVKEIKKYQDQTRKKTEIERQENKEKTGVELKGIVAINPANKKEIPVWIADYVLSGYGTGAIMAVPAHDERDFEFAKKFELPITPVVRVPDEDIGGCGAVLETVKGMFLFQKRDQKAPIQPGMIALFGGGREPGENILSCLKRELEEELELDISKRTAKYIGDAASRTRPGKYYSIFHIEDIDLKTLKLHEGESIVEMSLQEALSHKLVTEFTKKRIELFLKGYSETVFTGNGISMSSDFLDGLETPKATEKMISWLEKNGVGERKTTFKLRDWVFSRQRYWGEPIPMVYCEHCGWNPITDNELPLVLPDVKNYEPTDTGESPLSTMTDWVKASCPICQGEARRETDTMPNWAGSSWYFLRYCDPNNKEAFASRRAMEYWMPVDLYNGGMEHTTLHLLYSRFWYKFLFDRGFVPSSCGSEPYASRRSHAMILGEGGIKMSKSKGNVINPDDVVAEFGADVFRVYEMFMGPYDMDAPWDTHGIQGVKRFLDKAWNISLQQIQKAPLIKGDQGGFENVFDLEDVRPYENILHQTIKKVGDDIDNLRFNTAVSALMILTNELQTADLRARDFESYLKILAPFAPHMTEELWHMLGREDSIHASSWPAHDPDKLKVSEVEIAVQINGKVRGQVKVPAGSDEAFVRQAAEQVENVKKHLEGKTPKKIIYIKDKILSFVI